MKLLRLIVILSAIVSIAYSSHAQVGKRPYANDIFSAYTVDSVNYTDSLYMTVYQPVGDTTSQRPVIVLAHGGSFVRGGNLSNDSTVVRLCKTFAKRGYVTASIDYRVTINPLLLIDSLQAVDIVMKAVSDGKAAIRYFREDAATTNTFRVDTTQIFGGGNSAGAILMVHVAYIDSVAEVNSFVGDAIAANGGLEGDGDHKGHSSRIKGVINLAGGINNLDWYQIGSVPMVSCQGDLDSTVPYNCSGVLTRTANQFSVKTVNICGTGAMKDYADGLGGLGAGIEDRLLTFPGDDHTPWQNDLVKMAKVTSFVDSFMVDHTIWKTGNVAGINPVDNSWVNVYPNPAKGKFVVETTSNNPYQVEVFNTMGQSLWFDSHVTEQHHEVNVTSLPDGLYVVKLYDAATHTAIHTTKLLLVK